MKQRRRMTFKTGRALRRVRGMRGLGELGDMGEVEGLIVGGPKLPPGVLYQQGMAGLDGSLADAITGGAITNLGDQLARVELALKISTAAAVVGLLVHVLMSMSTTRRKTA